MSVRDVIIIGAGPSGLSAAIAAKQRGLDYQVLEQGVLVNSIYRFPPQMVFFTTPELLEIGGLPFVSPYDKPTRAEALKYYRKVVDMYDLRIAYEERVRSVEREHDGVFAIETESARALRPFESLRVAPSTVEGRQGQGAPSESRGGARRARHARHVVMAIGYYDHPVLIGVPGENLPHVRHYYGEPHPHYRQRVVIVGGGNSAAESALEMFRAGAHVTLVHRAPALKPTIKYWVRPDIENRINEGSIIGKFGMIVKEIRPTSIILQKCTNSADGAKGAEEELPADAVYLLTGYRADADLLTRAGVVLDERQAPVHDPETFETNVPGLFVAGGAIAGIDTGTIFIENGRFHGEKIIEVIARRG